MKDQERLEKMTVVEGKSAVSRVFLSVMKECERHQKNHLVSKYYFVAEIQYKIQK